MYMKHIEINKTNINLLKTFIALNDSNTFRYYDKRDVNVIQNHIVTLITVDDSMNNIIGYGHLDADSNIWLGICILKNYRGKGYGNKIMEKLISIAYTHQVEKITLTVDKTNKSAIMLYNKFGFIIDKECTSYYIMSKYL